VHWMHSYLAKQAGVRELSATGAQGQEFGPVIGSRRIKQPSGAAHTEPARSGAPCSGAALNQIGGSILMSRGEDCRESHKYRRQCFG